MRSHIQWRWHLEEVFVRINGETYYLWRAVDHEGEVLEVFVTKRRDRKAALRFLRKAMKLYGRPEVIVTDGLRSSHAAMKVIGNEARQVTGRWMNNRAENSHQPLPRNESERWRNSGAQNHYRNSPRSILQFIIISIKTATSTAVTSSSKIAPPLWLSGVSLRPEIYRLQGCADRFELI
jgi:putative transposase